MSHEFERELEVAIDAVRRASIVCRGVQSGIDGDSISKEDRSPVTIADYASQAVVCRSLKEAFDDDPIIGEEDSAQLQDADGDHYLPQIQSALKSSVIQPILRQFMSRLISGTHKITHLVSGQSTRLTEPKDFCEETNTRWHSH